MVEQIKGVREAQTPKQNIFLTNLAGDSEYSQSERATSAKASTVDEL